MPKNWRLLCHEVRARDASTCRRCGLSALGRDGAVNHIIPRRIAPALVADLGNLCLLCLPCHAWATSWLEPALYRGSVLAFSLFLKTIQLSGPVPTPEQLGAAYNRIRVSFAYGALVEEERDRGQSPRR